MKDKFLLLAAFLLSAHCASAVLIASDGFDDGSFSDATVATGNGFGWKANTWTASTGTIVIDTTQQSGSHGAQIANGSDRFFSRTIDLSNYENVTLSFFWGHRFMEAGEELLVQFDNGSGTFTTVETLTAVVNPNSALIGFFSESSPLNTSSLTGTTQAVRFISANTGGTDFFYIDTIEVNGTLIPEPSTAVLLGAVGVLGLLRRRR